MDLHELRRYAHPHGLLVRAEITPGVVSSSGWQRLHAFGMLAVVHRGVSRLVDSPRTFEQSAMAAVLAVGANARVAGPTAARLWGADTPSATPIHVLVGNRTSTIERPGIVAHRSSRHHDSVVHRRSGIPVCSAVRAVIGTAAWEPELLQPVIEELVVARRVTITQLSRALDDHARQGRPGVTALRRALLDWSLGEWPADSVLEARMGDVLRQYRIPTPQFQMKIGRYRPDFTWPDERVIVECDGWGAHGRNRQQFERDRERDAHLQAGGYVVWRFSWQQITNRSNWVAAQVLAALRTRRSQLGLDLSGLGAA